MGHFWARGYLLRWPEAKCLNIEICGVQELGLRMSILNASSYAGLAGP